MLALNLITLQTCPKITLTFLIAQIQILLVVRVCTASCACLPWQFMRGHIIFVPVHVLSFTDDISDSCNGNI